MMIIVGIVIMIMFIIINCLWFLLLSLLVLPLYQNHEKRMHGASPAERGSARMQNNSWILWFCAPQQSFVIKSAAVRTKQGDPRNSLDYSLAFFIIHIKIQYYVMYYAYHSIVHNRPCPVPAAARTPEDGWYSVRVRRRLESSIYVCVYIYIYIYTYIIYMYIYIYIY